MFELLAAGDHNQHHHKTPRTPLGSMGALGVFFQARDDLLNLASVTGREARGQAIRAGKLSYPAAWALDHAAPGTIEALFAALPADLEGAP